MLFIIKFWLWGSVILLKDWNDTFNFGLQIMIWPQIFKLYKILFDFNSRFKIVELIVFDF